MTDARGSPANCSAGPPASACDSALAHACACVIRRLQGPRPRRPLMYRYRRSLSSTCAYSCLLERLLSNACDATRHACARSDQMHAIRGPFPRRTVRLPARDCRFVPSRIPSQVLVVAPSMGAAWPTPGPNAAVSDHAQRNLPLRRHGLHAIPWDDGRHLVKVKPRHCTDSCFVLAFAYEKLRTFYILDSLP